MASDMKGYSPGIEGPEDQQVMSEEEVGRFAKNMKKLMESRKQQPPKTSTLYDEDEGKTSQQIDQEERLAWAKRVYRHSNKKVNPYRE